jgi:hypothetical protein
MWFKTILFIVNNSESLNITRLDNVPSNLRYIEIVFNKVMSNNSNRMIVFASILGAILATGLLALNPSTITNVGAQMYRDQYGYDRNYYQDDNRYGYDNNHPEKKNVNVQKIKCVNSNINVKVIDITQIPEDNTALGAAADEGGAADAANTQNGNGLADRINFEKNLVNICLNVNVNEQVKVSGPQQDQACEECFATLSVQDRNGFLAIVDAILNSEEIDVEINTIADLCEFLETSTDLTSTENGNC